MKRVILFTFILFSLNLYSQRSGISYQALILDPSGEQLPGFNNQNSPLINTDICLEFIVLDENNRIEYSELQNVKTDKFGMVNLTIGTGSFDRGYSGGWNLILWNEKSKKLKVNIDTSSNCSNFIEISEQNLTAVPFALFAPGAQGKQGESAYDIWLRNGNNGDEKDFLNSLMGTKGATGADGADGATGATGATGNGIASSANNGDGTFTLTYDDGTTFTTDDLTGPTGATGATGSSGTNTIEFLTSMPSLSISNDGEYTEYTWNTSGKKMMIRLMFSPYSNDNEGSGTFSIRDNNDTVYFSQTYTFKRSWDGGHHNLYSVRLNITASTTQIKFRLLKNSGFSSTLSLSYYFGDIMLY